jgi:septal ring factor EnvC (AmiA/AmiB activator)
MALPPTLRSIVLGMALLGASNALMAAPPAAGRADTAATLQTQVKDVDAKIAAAHAQNMALQAQVSQQEQQNAARAKQLQQRDAEIAALQQKLQAAGVPTSASSAGHRP